MSERFISSNLKTLVKAFKEGKRGVLLEGSSRSMKTWSGIDFLILLCSRYLQNEKIIITRETFNSFKTTLYDDFNRRFPQYGIPSPFSYVDNVTKFKLFGNTIHLLGADDPNKFEGAGSGFFWMNEVLDQPQAIFDQLEQRCRLFWWADYNPKALNHWVYDKLCNRPDVVFLKTTFKDNPFISKPERDKILSYDPNNPINIINGTADEFRWNVYGLGLRSSREGAIFKNWKKGEFDNTLPFGYGLDFGSRDPDALVKVAIDNQNKKIYVKELLYQNGLSTDQLMDILTQRVEKNKIIIADSSGTRTILDLKGKQLSIKPVVKTPIVDGIKLLLNYELIIDPSSNNLINELVNYIWLEKKGEIPSDTNNHCFIGETEIETKNGLKKIIDIEASDYVLTSYGYKKVLKKFNNGLKQVNNYLIQFDTFSLSLSCTKEHLIKTDKGWIQISQLKSGMTVYLSKNLMENFIDYTLKKDIFQEVQKECTRKFGRFIMVRLQKAFMFIIKILIPGTIELKIWNLKKRQNINPNIARNEQKTIRNGLKNFNKPESPRLRNGINQMRGWSGIKNTVLKHGSEGNIKHLSVNIVEKNIQQDTQEYQNFVEIIVRHVRCENGGVKNVYDLNIEGKHEYFANGILVHNCIDALRYYVITFVKPFKNRPQQKAL